MVEVVSTCLLALINVNFGFIHSKLVYVAKSAMLTASLKAVAFTYPKIREE